MFGQVGERYKTWVTISDRRTGQGRDKTWVSIEMTTTEGKRLTAWEGRKKQFEVGDKAEVLVTVKRHLNGGVTQVNRVYVTKKES